MQDFKTSEHIYSRIVAVVGVLVGGAKSCKRERITRVMMLQHRVSRMRRAWVQNIITGSKISGEERIKCRMESGFAPGCCGALGSVDSAWSGSILTVSRIQKAFKLTLGTLTTSLRIQKTCHHDNCSVGQLSKDTLWFHFVCQIAIRDSHFLLFDDLPFRCDLAVNMGE